MQGEFLTGLEYLQVLTRRWWYIVIAVLAALAAAMFLSARATPMYAASADVLVNQRSASDLFDPNASNASGTSILTRQTANEARFIESDIVRLAAEEELGFSASITAVTDSRNDVITLRAEASDPADAQMIARVFAETYLSERRQRYIDDFVLASADVQVRLDALDDQLDELPENADAERERLDELKRSLLASRDQLSIAAELASGGGGQIIELPDLPRAPFSPKTGRNLVFAIVLGLTAGVGAAVVRDMFDESITSPQDLETISGVPHLAMIPGARRNKRNDDGVVALNSPDSERAEAYRTLRAAVQFMAIDQNAQVLQITSANAGEGKTTTSANLAVLMAMAGRSSVIVDADLRKPRLHERFGTSQQPGFTDVVLGDSSLSQAQHIVQGSAATLTIVPSGPTPPFASELLSHETAFNIIQELRKHFDLVIVDSPPVLPVADALVISRLVDATILVANGRRTSRNDVIQAMELLRKVEAPVVGAVLNEVKESRWSVGYGYGYGSQTERAGKKRVTRSNATPRPEVPSETVAQLLRQPPAAHVPQPAAQVPPTQSNGDRAATSQKTRNRPAPAPTTPAQQGTPTTPTRAKQPAPRPVRTAGTSDQENTSSSPPRVKQPARPSGNTAAKPAVEQLLGDHDIDWLHDPGTPRKPRTVR